MVILSACVRLLLSALARKGMALKRGNGLTAVLSKELAEQPGRNCVDQLMSGHSFPAFAGGREHCVSRGFQ